jgi:PAS domain S-box-containing protein
MLPAAGKREKVPIELLSALLLVPGVGITLRDEKGCFYIFNTKMEEITGYTRDEANSRPDFLPILQAEIQGHAEVLPDGRKDGGKSNHLDMERVIRAKDGSMKTLHISMVKIVHRGEYYFLTTCCDISEQKKTEETLQQSEAEWRTLFETSRDAIMIFDGERFMDCNKATLSLFGYSSKEDFLNKHPAELSPPQQRDGSDSHAAAAERITAALANGTQFFQWTHRRLDGSVFPAEILLSRFENGGKVMLQAMVRDITERRLAEEQLQNARLAAEIACRVKGDFLANISHELHTPLNSIIGFSDVLRTGIFGALNDKQTEYLNTIAKNGRRLYELIRNMLDMAQADSGPTLFKPARFPLTRVLYSAVGKYIEKGLLQGITIDLQIEPEAEREIEADERKIAIVLQNLLDNAIKFSPEGGPVTVRARGVDADWIEISVTDEGIGVDPDIFPHLFSAFEQGESPYAKKYAGVGLGLCLAKQLIEQHGGSIWLEDGVGRGSRFTFVVPVRPVDGK